MSKYTSQEMVKAPAAVLLSFPDKHVKPSDQAFDEAGDRSDLRPFCDQGLFAERLPEVLADGTAPGIWRRTSGSWGKD